MSLPCQLSDWCLTSALKWPNSPYTLWFGHRLYLGDIPTFGEFGYLRRFRPEHKFAARGAKCIMPGIAEGFLREIFRVQDLNTGEVLFHLAPPTPQAKIRGPGLLAKVPQRNTDVTRHGALVLRVSPHNQVIWSWTSKPHERSGSWRFAQEKKPCSELRWSSRKSWTRTSRGTGFPTSKRGLLHRIFLLDPSRRELV